MTEVTDNSFVSKPKDSLQLNLTLTPGHIYQVLLCFTDLTAFSLPHLTVLSRLLLLPSTIQCCSLGCWLLNLTTCEGDLICSHTVMCKWVLPNSISSTQTSPRSVTLSVSYARKHSQIDSSRAIYLKPKQINLALLTVQIRNVEVFPDSPSSFPSPTTETII